MLPSYCLRSTLLEHTRDFLLIGRALFSCYGHFSLLCLFKKKKKKKKKKNERKDYLCLKVIYLLSHLIWLRLFYM